MRQLALTSLLLVIVLVSLSAYLRLSHSGIGCADWPACYGLIGNASDSVPTVESTLERLATETQQASSWATPAHRLIASALGLAVLAMALIAIAQKRHRKAGYESSAGSEKLDDCRRYLAGISDWSWRFDERELRGIGLSRTTDMQQPNASRSRTRDCFRPQPLARNWQ